MARTSEDITLHAICRRKTVVGVHIFERRLIIVQVSNLCKQTQAKVREGGSARDRQPATQCTVRTHARKEGVMGRAAE